MPRALLILCVIASVAGVTAASATPPGKNGPIAFRRYFDNRQTRGAVFTMRPDRSRVRQITRPPQGIVETSASATPPGKNGRIAFRRYFDAAKTTGAVFVVNADGKGEHQVTHVPQGTSDDQPDWAPNGSRIIFTRCPPGGCSIWAVNPDGSHLQHVSGTCRGSQLPPACVEDSSPAYSPDGRQIAFTRATGKVINDAVMSSNQIKSSALTIADTHGKHARRLISFGPFACDLDGAVWSPDGTRLAFTRHNSGFSKPHGGLAVFVVNVDGSGLRQLTPWSMSGGDHPDWSPDGKQILFRTEPIHDGPGGNYYTVRLDGTGLKQLTHFPSSRKLASASFSPDGKWIVFAKDGGVGGLADVFVMKTDGSGIRPLTRSPRWDSAPDWGSH